jgi:hypothetical protein
MGMKPILCDEIMQGIMNWMKGHEVVIFGQQQKLGIHRLKGWTKEQQQILYKEGKDSHNYTFDSGLK